MVTSTIKLYNIIHVLIVSFKENVIYFANKMFQKQSQIAFIQSIENPLVSRALKRALDPCRNI